MSRQSDKDGRERKLKARREWGRKNKEHLAAYRREYRKRVDHRKYKLKQCYGLTVEQYEKMLDEQNRLCAICFSHTPNSKLDWCVDHDHQSGKVRGILCHPCNTLLGAARDNQTILASAMNYLGKHNG